MEKWPGAPDAGNLHVRCEEGEGAVGETAPLYSTENQCFSVSTVRSQFIAIRMTKSKRMLGLPIG